MKKYLIIFLRQMKNIVILFYHCLYEIKESFSFENLGN